MLKEEVPKPDAKDAAHIISRAAVGSIPIVGGAAATLMEFIPRSLERRRDAFMAGLAQKLEQVADRVENFDVRNLADDGEFLSVLVRAHRTADETSSPTKREALRNAVVNAAYRTDFSADEVERFMRLIDELRPLHLQFLALLNDPSKYAMDRSRALPKEFPIGSSARAVIDAAEPSFAGEAVLEQAARDLDARGLAQVSMTGMTTGRDLVRSYTSDTGRKFVDFISEPRALHPDPSVPSSSA